MTKWLKSYGTSRNGWNHWPSYVTKIVSCQTFSHRQTRQALCCCSEVCWHVCLCVKALRQQWLFYKLKCRNDLESFEEQLSKAVRNHVHMSPPDTHKGTQMAKNSWMKKHCAERNQSLEKYGALSVTDCLPNNEYRSGVCNGKIPMLWCVQHQEVLPMSSVTCVSWFMKGVCESKCLATMWRWVNYLTLD